MEHQYPAPISGDESMLAELMLPDQTHVRSQDWTIFFLHKDADPDEEEESLTEKKKTRRKSHEQLDGDASDDDGDSSEEDDEGGEGPPLMYVLNLVNTKQDNTVKRYVQPLVVSSPSRSVTDPRRIWTGVLSSRPWLFAHDILFYIYIK